MSPYLYQIAPGKLAVTTRRKEFGIDTGRIFEDEIFTFLVGPEAVRFNIHISALNNISEPLGYLMTNQKMKESLEKQAPLEDVEPDIFRELVKYAYSGLCGATDGVQKSEPQGAVSFNFRCFICGTSCRNENKSYPFCSTHCRTTYDNNYYPSNRYNFKCVHPTCGATTISQCGTSLAVLCNNHNTAQNWEKYCFNRTTGNFVIGTQLPNPSPFACREYGYAHLSHTDLHSHLQNHQKISQPITDITTHAKLYVLADKYMIPHLKDICLHKLHNNLVATKITDETIDYLIELILYTYANTSDEGDILRGTANKLRDLVMAYAAEHSKEIIQYPAFRHMLSAGGTQAADFMALALTQIGSDGAS